MAQVELVGVTKHFGEVLAVSDLSLTVPDQEFVTLLGPSGCGKTTTLNLVAGLEELDRGDVYLDGVDITPLPPNRRDMAMVFQTYALYPHMRVFDNIAFGLRLAKMPKDDILQRVRAVSEILEIGHLLDRRPRELSGGQRQRVALGRALARHPRVFLMDEPLSNLDAKLRVRMRFEIKQLHLEQKATTIYVTHDQAEAMTMSDHIAIMDAGALQQYGSPRDVYDCPANLFVAGFVGSPSMNLIAGEWRAVDGGAIVRADAAEFNLPPAVSEALQVVSAPQSIVLGIRLEDIEVGSVLENPSARGEILVVEPIGPDDYLHVGVHHLDLMVRVPAGEGYKRGDKVALRFKPRGIHVFDAGTEQRVDYEAAMAGATEA